MYLIISITLLILTFIISIFKPSFRKLLIFTNAIISILYILWRVTTIPTNNFISFILGITLYSAELLGLISFLIFQFLFTKKYKLIPKSLKDFKDGQVPTVDVLICTYNEPLELLKKTIVASKNLNYPKDKFKVYVCDDGKRNELKELCKLYDVNYITRNDNKGAKAGNINNAINIISGDLFAVLDADMIPKKEFLNRTVGYFSNKNTAFVQTPQVYYNQDMYQYNLSKNIPNEQDFFMRNIEEARASINAVLHVGTNAVFNRQYVLNIGGYPTCSITEDMAVGMLLQANGHDSVFINEELVLGLSATTFSELVKQRDRWCRGNLQVIKKFNIFFNKGLTLSQKIAYFDGVIYWLSSIQKLIYILSPIIYLLTSNLIIDTPVENLLTMFIPFLLGQLLIFKILSPKTRSLKWSHYYEIAMAPHISLSVLKELLALKINFNVTSKDITSNKKYFQFKIAVPHILIAITTIISWITGTLSLTGEKGNLYAYIINISWSFYNLIGIITSLKVAYQKPIYRKSERIKISETIKTKVIFNTKSLNGKLYDISESGLGIILNHPYNLEINSIVHIKFNNINLDCKVNRSKDKFIGLTYISLTEKDYENIMDIYVNNISSHYNTKINQKYS